MEQNSQPPQQSPGSGPQEDLLGDVYEDSMEGYDKPVKRVRILLFVIAGLQLLATFTAIDLPEPENWITIGLFVFLSGIFTVLAFWTKKKPYTAIITALSIYIALHALSAILEPASIIRGIIVKGIVIVMLISALKNAKEIQQWLDAKKEREGL
jgi:prepilin signal peptidase PulO-like enzyme (type II secretory pathway)